MPCAGVLSVLEMRGDHKCSLAPRPAQHVSCAPEFGNGWERREPRRSTRRDTRRRMRNRSTRVDAPARRKRFQDPAPTPKSFVDPVFSCTRFSAHPINDEGDPGGSPSTVRCPNGGCLSLCLYCSLASNTRVPWEGSRHLPLGSTLCSSLTRAIRLGVTDCPQIAYRSETPPGVVTEENSPLTELRDVESRDASQIARIPATIKRKMRGKRAAARRLRPARRFGWSMGKYRHFGGGA